MDDVNDCGCCTGTAIDTPTAKANAPGLSAIAYRIGTQPDFKSTLLARLSSTDYPALNALRTRGDDDWTIALCDAFACVADVLTFYQERLANEAFLRTATERRSVLELARLIGYELSPGVAASTAFAFMLQTSPGQPALAAQPVSIPVGTRVQSVADPNQDPQNFETIAVITARVEWNAIAAQTAVPLPIQQGLTELYIDGTTTQVQPGDAILLVGRERRQDATSDSWDIRWLDTVETDPTRNLTHLVWSTPLGSQSYYSPPTAQGIHLYVFRQRAALFGNNAPNPQVVLTQEKLTLLSGQLNATQTEWNNVSIDVASKRIDLDAGYPKIVRNSWVALAGGGGGDAPTGYVELYRVTGATQVSRAAYATSGKLTRLVVDGDENLDDFDFRETFVLGQSDELSMVPRPLYYPLYGNSLTLAIRQPDLVPGQLIAVSGKLQRIALPVDLTGVALIGDAGRAPLQPSESFQMLSAPEQQLGSGEWQVLDPPDLDPALAFDTSILWQWNLLDHDGTTLTVQAPAGALVLQAALSTDDVLSEVAAIDTGADGISSDLIATTLTLQNPMANCYDRTTVSVNANVAPATHGETVGEIAGSGDASQASQSFQLKQSPLTYVSSTDPSGSASTLQASVNGVLWSERSTLYGSGAKDRVYALSQDDNGNTTMLFGDGVEGARLPTGQNNVRVSYRRGLGTAGNLRGGQLTSLLTRPLGVKSVTNPQPSTGGQDPEQLDQARENAPLHVLTLDRAVSTQDYADYSRTFAGIAKAHAIWIDTGRARGIHVTVAGADGGDIPDGSATQSNLIASLRQYGDPLLPLVVKNHGKPTFTLQATVKISPDVDLKKTLAAVEAALRTAYSFDARDFGQPVPIDEVYAVMQSVAGVIATDIQQLYRLDDVAATPQPQPRLIAQLPALQADGSVNAAELLTLDAGPLTLGSMS